MGVEIIATEGTARAILNNVIPVTGVSDFTGSQELLGGRIKTLHPRIHAGIATAESRRTKLRLAKEASRYLLAYDSQIDLLLAQME